MTSRADTLARLDAMRAQEETLHGGANLPKGPAGDDAHEEVECRRAMVAWMLKTQRTLGLDPDTAWRAASCADRYLASGRGRSREIRESGELVPLVYVTALYTSIKVFERVGVELDVFVRIYRGAITREEIAALEEEMLTALRWRLAVHTPMDVAQHLLALLPPERLSTDASDRILTLCRERVDQSVADAYFSSCRGGAPASVTGVACLASAVAAADAPSPAAKEALWSDLADRLEEGARRFDPPPEEVTAARRRLLSRFGPLQAPPPTTAAAKDERVLPSKRSFTDVSELS